MLTQFVEVLKEQWKEDHDRVMASFAAADEMSESVQACLALLGMFDAYFTRARKRFLSSEDARKAYRQFLDFSKLVEKVLESVDRLENDEFFVEGSTALRNALNNNRHRLKAMDLTVQSLDQIAQGRGHSLEEFLDAICCQ